MILYPWRIESGCIGLYIPENQEISRGPRDVLRTRPEGHLEGLGEISWSSGMYDQIHPASMYTEVYNHSLYINLSLGMNQEIHPCIAIGIDSVKINTFLIMINCFPFFTL